MENLRAGEEIFSRPQKDGETRTTTITGAKPQDHLNLQVSLNNGDDHTNAYSISFVVGILKHFQPA